MIRAMHLKVDEFLDDMLFVEDIREATDVLSHLEATVICIGGKVADLVLDSAGS